MSRSALNRVALNDHYNLANALEKLGAHESANLEFREAIRLSPDFNLGNAIARSGDLDGAMTENGEVVRLTPNDASAKENLRLVTAIKARLEGGRRLFSEHRYNALLDEVIAALDVDPRNTDALHLAGTLLYLCSSVHSQEKIRPFVSEDPLLDGLFSQCNRCHRFWPGNPMLKDFAGQQVVFNPLGGRCPHCQKVWCRECARSELLLSCPQCQVELELLKEPSGRKRGLLAAKHPDLRLCQVFIFKAPPKPRNATSYITLVLDDLCPEGFHSDAEICFHTGEEGTKVEAATQYAIVRWVAKGIKVDFDHTFRESFTDGEGGKGIILTWYEPKY